MDIKKQKLYITKPDLSASLVDYDLVLNLQFKHYHFMALIKMLVCVLFSNAALALLGGACFSYFLTGSAKAEFMGYGKKLLSSSIILLGFGVSLDQAISTGAGGFILTMYSIIFTIVIGLLLAKAFKLEQNTGYLLACGTAICGGSAIAAVSPAIQAKPHQVSTAFTVVFLLNAIALIVFPIIGRALDMSPERFAYWCAIAIHDTSSVVGAAQAYHPDSLDIATTVKLARSLWIIPVVLFLSELKGGKAKKQTFPMFIVYFCVAMIIAYLLPDFQMAYSGLYQLGKIGIVLALFFIGSSLDLSAMKQGGIKPFVCGLLMWLIISAVSLWVVLAL